MGQMAIPLMLAGGAYTAYAQYRAGQANKSIYERMASSSIAAGQMPESVALARGTRANAQATAGAASGNVDVASKSVADVVSGNKGLSALDAATVRYNSLMQAYGYRRRAEQAEQEGSNAAMSTLLTTGASVAGSVYKAGLFNPANTPVPVTSASDPTASMNLALPNLGDSLPTFQRGTY